MFDFSVPQYIEGFVLWRHNLTATSQVRLRLYSGLGQTGDLVYDSGLVKPDVLKALGDLVWGKDPLGSSALESWDLNSFGFWPNGSPLAYSGRLNILDGDNPDGYVEIGRIYCGDVFTPTYNFDLGSEFSWATDVDQIPTAGGTVHTLEAATYRTLSFNFNHLMPTDRTAFADMTRAVSTHKDFFIDLRPDAEGAIQRDMSFAAKFTNAPVIRKQASRYEASCTIREV